MTDNTLTADVSADLDDEVVDNYFESGGTAEVSNVPEEMPITNEAQPQEQDTAEQEQANETQQKAADKVVPYGALHEERERRKELQQQLREQQERTSRLEQTFQKVIERTQQPQQQQGPSFEEDPVEALRQEQEHIKQALRQQYQSEAQRQQQSEMQYKQQVFVERYKDSANAYAQENPEFSNAYQHLVQSRLAEYTAAGYSVQQANQLLIEDEMAIVAKAYTDGVNPAERIYALSKVRGYQTPASNQNNFQQQKTEQALQDNARKIAQLEKGMAASKSLSNAGGKTENSFSLESLAAMDDDELDNFLDKGWNKLSKIMV